MPRTPRNKLTIALLKNGSFKLHGYILGRRIQKRSTSHAELIALKNKLEASVAQAKQEPIMRTTWLTEAQIRDAEAACLAAQGTPLRDLVAIAMAAKPAPAESIEWQKAIKAWTSHLADRLGRYPRTVEKNRLRVAAFAKCCANKHVGDTTPATVENWVLRSGISPRTQLTDGVTLRAFFKFAVERNWAAANPVTVNLRELATRSHNTERPRILTPAQCQALTTAAKTMFDGELLAFIVLSTWCFMRRAEVIRTTPKDIDLSRGIVEVSPRKIGTPSYRRVSIPNNARTMLQWCIDQHHIPPTGVLFNRASFDAIRAAAGIVTLGPRTRRHARRAMLESAWQDNILRHTGISYLFAKSGDITDVCRQAGNSSSTAFRHYLDLPAPGAEKAFFKILP